MFRERAVVKEPQADLDRPFRLVTTPAAFGLVIALVAAIAGCLWLFAGQISVKASGIGIVVNPPGNVQVYADASGTVGSEIIQTGEKVAAGDVIATITTPDNTEVPVYAPIDGTVVSEFSAEYALISEGAPLVSIAPNTGPMVAMLFLPAAAVADVAAGQRVEVSPDTVDVTREGYLIGTVKSVDALPITVERLALLLGDDGLLNGLLAEGPVQEVLVEFEQDAQAPLGLKWSGSGPADEADVQSGTIVTGKIVLKNQTPWQAFTGG